RDIGYVHEEDRFSADTVHVDVRIQPQAAEIARAVDKTDPRLQGAGDQGVMFGYATSETPEFMPAPIVWAHRLTRRLAELGKSGVVHWLRPDAKSQVSVRYVDGEPVEITSIVVSTQHSRDYADKQDRIRAFVLEEVIASAMPGEYLGAGWQDR